MARRKDDRPIAYYQYHYHIDTGIFECEWFSFDGIYIIHLGGVVGTKEDMRAFRDEHIKPHYRLVPGTVLVDPNSPFPTTYNIAVTERWKQTSSARVPRYMKHSAMSSSFTAEENKRRFQEFADRMKVVGSVPKKRNDWNGYIESNARAYRQEQRRKEVEAYVPVEVIMTPEQIEEDKKRKLSAAKYRCKTCYYKRITAACAKRGCVAYRLQRG